jgi:hypothetical protein
MNGLIMSIRLLSSPRQGPWNVDLRTPPGQECSNGSLLRIRRGHPGTFSSSIFHSAYAFAAFEFVKFVKFVSTLFAAPSVIGELFCDKTRAVAGHVSQLSKGDRNRLLRHEQIPGVPSTAGIGHSPPP